MLGLTTETARPFSFFSRGKGKKKKREKGGAAWEPTPRKSTGQKRTRKKRGGGRAARTGEKKNRGLTSREGKRKGSPSLGTSRHKRKHCNGIILWGKERGKLKGVQCPRWRKKEKKIRKGSRPLYAKTWFRGGGKKKRTGGQYFHLCPPMGKKTEGKRGEDCHSSFHPVDGREKQRKEEEKKRSPRPFPTVNDGGGGGGEWSSCACRGKKKRKKKRKKSLFMPYMFILGLASRRKEGTDFLSACLC